MNVWKKEEENMNGILSKILSFVSNKNGGRRQLSLFLIIGVVLALVIGFYLISLKYNPNVTSSTESITEATTSDMFPWEDKVIDGQDVDITGKWFEPHGASHNIVFNQDSSFVYHTYSFPTSTTSQELIYTGKYRKEGIKISLSDEQGWKSVMYIRHNGTNYYLSDSIKARGIYLVHGSE